MDKVHCNIIQDLLPLYADDVVSPESKAMVDAHLISCPKCREILEEIRSSIPVPQHSDTTLFKKIKRKQRIKTVVLAVVIVLFFYAIIGAPVVAYVKDSFVEYNAEDCIVSESQDGSPIIEMSDRAKGANIYYLYDVDDSGNTEVYICIDSNRRSAVYDFISRLYKLDFSGDSIYVTPTLGISEQAQNYSNFPGVQALLFDGTVTAIYYLPITTEQQTDFYTNYLSLYEVGGAVESLTNYEIKSIDQRILLWIKE